MGFYKKRKYTSRLLSIAITILFCSFIINITLAFPVLPNFKQKLKQYHILVVKDHPTLVDVIEKQLTDAPIEELGLIEQPAFGTVTIKSMGSFTFIPKPNTCEEKDEFTYFIRTAEGYDTVTVAVEIICESLTIINGFSPDGTGEVTTFTILGVQNFPNNSLIVFNKWGEAVYSKKGYENEWNGETSDGDSLASEDSLYYYVFNDGEGKSYSGYLQIWK